MALSTIQKNIAIAVMEDAVAKMKTAAGISDLGEIETDVNALRTAFDTDPATATDAAIDDAHDKIVGLAVPSLNSLTSLWTAADQDV